MEIIVIGCCLTVGVPVILLIKFWECNRESKIIDENYKKAEGDNKQ